MPVFNSVSPTSCSSVFAVAFSIRRTLRLVCLHSYVLKLEFCIPAFTTRYVNLVGMCTHYYISLCVNVSRLFSPAHSKPRQFYMFLVFVCDTLTLHCLYTRIVLSVQKKKKRKKPDRFLFLGVGGGSWGGRGRGGLVVRITAKCEIEYRFNIDRGGDTCCLGVGVLSQTNWKPFKSPTYYETPVKIKQHQSLF